MMARPTKGSGDEHMAKRQHNRNQMRSVYHSNLIPALAAWDCIFTLSQFFSHIYSKDIKKRKEIKKIWEYETPESELISSKTFLSLLTLEELHFSITSTVPPFFPSHQENFHLKVFIDSSWV